MACFWHFDSLTAVELELCHLLIIFFCTLDMSTTAFIEPLPVVEFVTKLLPRDVTSRPLADSDRVKVRSRSFF